MSPLHDEVVALFGRPDLHAVGVVFGDPQHPDATTTIWQRPTHGDCAGAPLEDHQRRTGQVPSALVCVLGARVDTYRVDTYRVETYRLRGWRAMPWLETYVAHLAQTIADAGSVEAFFATLADPARN